MAEQCFFNCSNTSSKLINCGARRIETIRNCSIRRGDGLVEKLHQVDSITCHKPCVSTYTSEFHVKRYLSKRQSSNVVTPESSSPTKRARRSGTAAFKFKEHCLFCGNKCLQKDSRHPGRWRRVVQCRTAGTMKQNIVHICDLRKDDMANDVRVRILGAVSDLHAADAQYHDDCYKLFMSHKNVQAAAGASSNPPLQDDPAFDALIQDIAGTKSCVWNSIEIQEAYEGHGGTELSRKKLVSIVMDHFGPDLLKLSGEGIADIFIFRSQAPHILKLADASDDVDPTSVAKIIKKECSDKAMDRYSYQIRLSQEDVADACSELLLKLLADLSPKLDKTNTALLIGNIITSVLTNRPTTLQITLGTLLREKALIESCAQFGITCSYDEVLRFKKSAAHAASSNKHLQGLMDSSAGLIQAVADNFDTNIASPNGLKSTHSLALLLTQVQDKTNNKTETKFAIIRRLRREELKEEHAPPVNIQRYNGARKPNMPEATHRQILPLRILAAKIITTNRVRMIDD